MYQCKVNIIINLTSFSLNFFSIPKYWYGLFMTVTVFLIYSSVSNNRAGRNNSPGWHYHWKPIRPKKNCLVTVARPTLFFDADPRFFFLVDGRKKKNAYGKKKLSKSVKRFKSYDFAVHSIELGQILLIKVAGCISNNLYC